MGYATYIETDLKAMTAERDRLQATAVDLAASLRHLLDEIYSVQGACHLFSESILNDGRASLKRAAPSSVQKGE